MVGGSGWTGTEAPQFCGPSSRPSFSPGVPQPPQKGLAPRGSAGGSEHFPVERGFSVGSGGGLFWSSTLGGWLWACIPHDGLACWLVPSLPRQNQNVQLPQRGWI